MGFLAPVFLLGALAAAVPIVLHLVRKRTEIVVDFSAVRLLARAPVFVHRRRRLRELVLLALRVAALVLLAGSFARPFFARAVAPASAPLTVVAVDTSLSLSAPGQMDRARAAAREAVETAPATDVVALVAFADAATVVVPPTADRRAVVAAIDRLEAGPGGTRYRTALAKATEVIGARRARVVVVTDLQQAGWDASDEGGLPDEVDCDVVAIPRPAGNLAVTAAVRRDDGVHATVQNYAGQPARTEVRLVVEGRSPAAATLDVGPFAAVDVRLDAELPSAGAARVEVSDEAGYQGDNIRHLVLDQSPPLPIAIVVADPTTRRSGIYMDRALAVAGEGREFDPEVVDGRALSAWSAAEMARQAAVVLIGTRTMDRRGRELVRQYLEAGGQVLLTLGPDVDPISLGDVLGVDPGVSAEAVKPPGGQAALVASDARHPIFRPFLTQAGALGDVLVEQYRRLGGEGGRTVLARLTGGDIALTEQRAGTGRLLVFASDLDNQWSRFPLHPSFVPFAVETARYLTEGRRRPQAWVLPDVPPGALPVPGVQVVGADRERIAVNVDTRESNPAATSPEEFTGGISRINRVASGGPLADVRREEERQRLWQFGLGLLLVALAAEGLVARRAV